MTIPRYGPFVLFQFTQYGARILSQPGKGKESRDHFSVRVKRLHKELTGDAITQYCGVTGPVKMPKKGVACLVYRWVGGEGTMHTVWRLKEGEDESRLEELSRKFSGWMAERQ